MNKPRSKNQLGQKSLFGNLPIPSAVKETMSYAKDAVTNLITGQKDMTIELSPVTDIVKMSQGDKIPTIIAKNQTVHIEIERTHERITNTFVSDATGLTNESISESSSIEEILRYITQDYLEKIRTIERQETHEQKEDIQIIGPRGITINFVIHQGFLRDYIHIAKDIEKHGNLILSDGRRLKNFSDDTFGKGMHLTVNNDESNTLFQIVIEAQMGKDTLLKLPRGESNYMNMITQSFERMIKTLFRKLENLEQELKQ